MSDDKGKVSIEAAGPGLIYKEASLTAQSVTEEELKKINKLTLEPLTAEQVFTFKAVLCDNEVDRTYERFTLKALQGFQKLFKGKTVIKDHYRTADNQVARIYDTELVPSTKVTKAGEVYTQLVAYCYMVKTAGNADLIAEIKAGIKKEGSVGCAVANCFCSICGTDNAQSYCRHYAGRSYAKEGGEEVCTFALDTARDAYEFSLVAVPAQKAAGVSKCYTGEIVFEKSPDVDEGEAAPPEETDDKAKELELRAHHAVLRAKINSNK